MERSPFAAAPPQVRGRALAARPARLTAAALALFAVTVAATLLVAASAHASVWVIPSTARALPATKPGLTQTISLCAAGNEYEAAQVVLRGGDAHSVTFTWVDGGDPLITDNTTLRQVFYVPITHPSTDLHAKKGLYPDPLLPREFGRGVRVNGKTNSFYVQVHVPYGTPPGDHTATLHVANGSESVDIPFGLHVWDFGWQRLSTQVAFLLDANHLKKSVTSLGSGWWWRNGHKLQLNAASMLSEYGISSSAPPVVPDASSSGHISESSYASQMAPYLAGDGLDLQDMILPWVRWWPWNVKTYSASSARLSTYLTDVTHAIAANGWQKKAYAYIVDEPMTTAAERHAQALARVLHRASAKSGFRCRFLLTDDPRPRRLVNHPANGFLFDDVDIWAMRYYFFFGRVHAAQARQRAGKEVWWYTYVNRSAASMPGFLIEKPFTDERVWGWLMEQWHVQGLLNYGINRWCAPRVTSRWRDPYTTPLSYRNSNSTVSGNGDCSLIYPGYYPRYGLDDPLAQPVSSLRLEALRDGLEEREYLRAAKALGADGQAEAKKVLATITWYPYSIKDGVRYLFPKYQKAYAPYDRARLALGAFIDAHQN